MNIILSIIEDSDDHSNWIEALFFNQRVRFRNIIRNDELVYMKFFKYKTKLFCENVILYGKYVFYFVKPNHFRKASKHLVQLRTSLPSKKILIIKNERRILDLIYAFFPDASIKKLELKIKKVTGDIELFIYFKHFRERGIAIGKKGNFIRILNEVFEKYIYPVKISCLYTPE